MTPTQYPPVAVQYTYKRAVCAEIRTCHGSHYQDEACSLLIHGVVQFGRKVPTFRSDIVPVSSGRFCSLKL